MNPSRLALGVPWAILPNLGEKLLADEVAPLEASWTAAQPILAEHTQGGASLAVLPIGGVILPYSSPLASLLGATCLDQLTEDFCRACDNPDVKAILLRIDSPGGMITGVHAFSQQVFAARQIKPIVAVVSGLAASAAYWIAAAASEVWVDPTASLGSIGVIATYQNTGERDKKAGIHTTAIISSQSPHKRLDLTTDTGRSQCQQHVDTLAEVFINAVATYRNVSPEKVVTDFGQGGLVVGEAAVRQGLADRMHTFSGFNPSWLHHVTGELPMSRQPAKKNALQEFIESPAYKEHNDQIKAMIKEEDDDIQALYDEGFAAGLVAGKAQERERLQAIEAQALPGHEALIQTLKWDGVSTASDVAMKILAAEKAKKAALHVEAVADIPAPLPPVLMEATGGKALSFAEKCQKEWENSPALQAEFWEADIYSAYREAESKGLIKRLS